MICCIFANLLSKYIFISDTQVTIVLNDYSFIYTYSTCFFQTDRPARPSVTLLTTTMEGEPAAPIATCSTSGFSPGNINVTWQLEGTTAIQEEDLVITQIDNILFSVSSTFNYSVDRSDNGKTLTCTVYHQSLPAPLANAASVPVLCK